jgi:hypothetical protein
MHLSPPLGKGPKDFRGAIKEEKVVQLQKWLQSRIFWDIS